jgi:hypothetical protein
MLSTAPRITDRGRPLDTATDDPFYGFNDGATHVRVGGDGNPQFYQFEGLLVRLMEDEDYRVPMHGGQQAYLSRSADGSQPRASVWVYRFYDPDADTLAFAAEPRRPRRPDLHHRPATSRPSAPRPPRRHRPEPPTPVLITRQRIPADYRQTAPQPIFRQFRPS